ncbi:MAG: metal-sensing transcriptional repressor [Actinomycetaceae bacterium]|nr:metal-sensing transcriptional repressor [Actinomycetaceae bacterium]
MATAAGAKGSAAEEAVGEGAAAPEEIAASASGAPVIDADKRRQIRHRLARANGQLAGVIRLLDAGADCEAILTQMVATSKALDRAAVALVLCGLEACPAGDTPGSIEVDPEAAAHRKVLEKLLLSLV